MERQALLRQFLEAKDALDPRTPPLRTLTEMYILLVSFFNYMESRMDKQINKVVKDVKSNNKPKSIADLAKLKKMDVKQDKKVAKCDKKMAKRK